MVPMIWQAQFDTKFIMIRNRALEIILYLFKNMDPNNAEARVLNSLIQLDAQGQVGLQKQIMQESYKHIESTVASQSIVKWVTSKIDAINVNEEYMIDTNNFKSIYLGSLLSQETQQQMKSEKICENIQERVNEIKCDQTDETVILLLSELIAMKQEALFRELYLEKQDDERLKWLYIKANDDLLYNLQKAIVSVIKSRDENYQEMISIEETCQESQQKENVSNFESQNLGLQKQI